MRNLEEDKTSPEQLLASFQALATDNKFVTEADLYRGSIPPHIVEHLKTIISKTDGGYDYVSFVSTVFDNKSQ